MDDGPQPIHGAIDPRLKDPIMVERHGRKLRVVTCTPRQDLQLAAWKAGVYRAYRELTLSDSTQLLVFHGLVQGGWYELPLDSAPAIP